MNYCESTCIHQYCYIVSSRIVGLVKRLKSLMVRAHQGKQKKKQRVTGFPD